jgi:hypothetical protein
MYHNKYVFVVMEEKMETKVLSRFREELIFTPLAIIDMGAASLSEAFLPVNKERLSAIEQITAENNVKDDEPLSLFIQQGKVVGISLIPTIERRCKK